MMYFKEMIAVFTIIFILIVWFIQWYKHRQVLGILDKYISALAKGEIPEQSLDKVVKKYSSLSKHLNDLNNNTLQAISFTQQVGKGNFELSIKENAYQNSALWEAMYTMKDQLEQQKKAQEGRFWITQGLSILQSFIQRTGDLQIEEWAEGVLQHLCQYVDIEQSCIYYLDKEYKSEGAQADGRLEKLAQYASARQLPETIPVGVGLLGQAVQLQRKTLLKDIPDNFFAISSGLGESQPKTVFIQPLMYDFQVLGVLEVASLREFDKYEQELIVRISESIAAAIFRIKANKQKEALLNLTKTQKLQLEKREQTLMDKMAELEATKKDLEVYTEELNEEKELTTKSIECALTVQQAILPDLKQLSNFSSEQLIVYKPKDIVSGDFYWYGERDGAYYVAVCDCTGHGVPGAMISVVAKKLLDEALLLSGDLKDIVTYISDQMYQIYNREQDRFGMDVSICQFKKNKDKTVNMTFLGTKSSIYLYSAKTAELDTIKGVSYTIGVPRHRNPLETSEYLLEKGDTIVMCSDGFGDQCNPERKRFGRKRLAQLLLSLQESDFNQHQNLLENTLTEYMDGESQRDDITLLEIQI